MSHSGCVENGQCSLFAEAIGLNNHFRRHPIWKVYRLQDMLSRWRMLFNKLRYLIRAEAPGATHQSGPETLMHKRDFPIDEPTHQDLVRFPHGQSRTENLFAKRVRPPTAHDLAAHNGLRKRRHRPLRRLQDDAMLLDERDCLSGRQSCLLCKRSVARVTSRFRNDTVRQIGRIRL